MTIWQGLSSCYNSDLVDRVYKQQHVDLAPDIAAKSLNLEFEIIDEDASGHVKIIKVAPATINC